jgi:uracil-DNA glycosylase family 4
MDRVSSCQACSLHKNCRHKVGIRRSHPNINDYPPFIHILFVGEAPGQSEYALRTPFIGPAGQELSDLMSQCVPLSLRYAITNAVLCTPFTDESRSSIDTPSLPGITACRTHLQRLISILKPKHIIALGKIAERSLKKIVPQGPYVQNDLRFTTLLHPSAILRSTHPDLERARFILNLKAVVDKLCE